MNTEKELRARFNPDGSVLRMQQLRMLELLDFVDGVCKKHNIPYWLSSGTLIGAVRHKGFIPWDDDLDIEMMRKDYLRLLKVLPTELPDQYALQTHETDENYIFIFGKLRDKNSFLSETNDYDRIFKYRGIYIDIFPMEHLTKSVAWLGGHLHGQIYKQLKKKNIDKKTLLKRVNRIYSFNHHISMPVLRFFSRLFPVKEIRHSLGTAYFSPRYKEEIFPLAEIEFEGKLFPAPHDTYSYLKRIYGDYMNLPDLDKITPHFNKIEFFK
ncbi:LicD family protein [Bacteroides sp. 224]|nr:LicD family protein [Bacteroides sp. 224]